MLPIMINNVTSLVMFMPSTELTRRTYDIYVHMTRLPLQRVQLMYYRCQFTEIDWIDDRHIYTHLLSTV